MKKYLLNPIGMLAAGLLLGALSRVLDLYTQNLGNIFSQMAFWILLGVLISIYSSSKKRAMCNILPFCLGMLSTYYLVAFLTDGVYSKTMIIGWTLFALCSPVFAYFAWLTKEKSVLPKFIGVGIVVVSFLTSLVLFDRIRVYDVVINGILCYFLFFKKVAR